MTTLRTIAATAVQLSRWYPETMTPRIGDTVGVIRDTQEACDPTYEICAPRHVTGYREGTTRCFPSGGWQRRDDLGRGIVTAIGADDYDSTPVYMVQLDW